jgi:tetrahydromethanopterin S-methyltransferase subunit H
VNHAATFHNQASLSNLRRKSFLISVQTTNKEKGENSFKVARVYHRQQSAIKWLRKFEREVKSHIHIQKAESSTLKKIPGIVRYFYHGIVNEASTFTCSQSSSSNTTLHQTTTLQENEDALHEYPEGYGMLICDLIMYRTTSQLDS